jgi:hypothetical protein
MLIIISDIHLSDGTCGQSIPASAFHLFASRLRELALNASWKSNGQYQPIKEIDILLLGDILDPLHSTRWLETQPGESGYVRPWTDVRASEFVATLRTITSNILASNAEALGILKELSGKAALSLPPVTRTGQPDMNSKQYEPVHVHIHYMIGNHDWYYHLPGPAFEAIRREIVQSCGISNPSGPFPHEIQESASLQRLLAGYMVYARHGDIYDPLNYSAEKCRDAASVGDAFVVEVINRFPLEVDRQMKDDLSPEFMESLHQLVNIRPTLATPLWIGSQIRRNNINQVAQRKLKDLWNEICKEFLALPFVQEGDKPFKFDLVDELELAIHLTDRLSFKNIDDIVIWARRKFNSTEVTFARHACKEKAFLDRSAQFVVYGHTHHHEIVPLDSFFQKQKIKDQLYINSGTWHTYFDLATYKLEEQKFIPYHVLTYLTFYKDDERRGTRFETWTGTFSN